MNKLIAFLIMVLIAAGSFAANYPQPTVTISPNALDAFSRLNVSQPGTVFDSIFMTGPNYPIYEPINTNATATITWLTNQSSVKLSVWTASSNIVFQSRQWPMYIPGKSQFVNMTVVIPTTSMGIGQIVRWGQFGDQNGLYFQCSNGVMGVGLRSFASGAVVDTIVNRSNWNVDVMDGSGTNNPSGLSLNITNGIFSAIRYQWLGHGKVVYSVNYGGQFWPVHSFDHAGSNAVYMTTAVNPIRYEAKNLSTTGGTTNSIVGTCATVITEGVDNNDLNRGYELYQANQYNQSINTTQSEIISFRPAKTFGGITNRETVLPVRFNIYSDAVSLYEVQYGASLTGGTWYSSSSNSAVEWSTNSTLMAAGTPVTGGFIVLGGSSGGEGMVMDSASLNRYPIVLDNSGTNQSFGMSIIARTVSGTGVARGGFRIMEMHR